MSRTDHHRPYEIRAADPSTPLRYQPDRFLMFGQGDDAEWHLPYSHFVHPPHWYIRHVYTGRLRAADRAWSRAAIGAYRAGEEIPVEPDGRARNSAKWMWW